METLLGSQSPSDWVKIRYGKTKQNPRILKQVIIFFFQTFFNLTEDAIRNQTNLKLIPKLIMLISLFLIFQ